MTLRTRILFVLATLWTIFVVYTMRATRGVQPLYPLVTPSSEKIPEGVSETPIGKISGQVVWEGELPNPPLFLVPNVPMMPRNLPAQENPHVPKVKKGLLEGAIVWLEGVDPKRAKHWDHPPITLNAIGHEITSIAENKERYFVGFVPVGSTLDLQSQENEFASIRARGAEDFTVTLPKNLQPVRRTFRQTGFVELSSASGFYWARSWLLVLNHPYATRSKTDGTFTLEGVPSGTYTLNLWHPNWHITQTDRDPETTAIVRIQYAKPLHLKQAITIDEKGASSPIKFTLLAKDFEGVGK